MKIIIGALLVCVLASCNQLAFMSVRLTGEQSQLRVRGHSITLKLYTGGPADMSGFATTVGECIVHVHRNYLPTPAFGHIVAHEVGHCLDRLELGWTHNGWHDEGAAFGEYYSSPHEGFAEAFARAYTVACGESFNPLLYDAPCIPNPRDVKP
jgi:hypothetical protein